MRQKPASLLSFPVILFLSYFMSSLKREKTYRRQHARKPLVEGDVDLAEAVTHRRIAIPQDDGSIKIGQVLESLERTPSTPDHIAIETDLPLPTNNIHDDDPYLSRPPTPQQQRKGRTQKDYILEYMDRIDGLLEASLAREHLAETDIFCRHCDKNGVLSIWRCTDCALGSPMCRCCIRKYHQDNSFHRIEKWNGDFYRPAELWEVGIYLLIRHFTGTPICESLKAQKDFLELIEGRKDEAEQEILQSSVLKENIPTALDDFSGPNKNTPSAFDQSSGPKELTPSALNSSESLDEFMRYFNELRNDDINAEENPIAEEEEFEVEDDHVESDIDPPIVNHYMPEDLMAENNNCIGTPSAQRVIGSYIRVIHSNGIHNIAMISCECRGHDMLASDLVASRLLPASFGRIRTLFSVQVLDQFRLCNLELKASAYHYYRLLQRLTNPMNPSEVIDLYREFRRMTRIWRWMKKLKWAGYGNKTKKASDVKPGELAVFCPACPQPNINIPNNWKEDRAR